MTPSLSIKSSTQVSCLHASVIIFQSIHHSCIHSEMSSTHVWRCVQAVCVDHHRRRIGLQRRGDTSEHHRGKTSPPYKHPHNKETPLNLHPSDHTPRCAQVGRRAAAKRLTLLMMLKREARGFEHRLASTSGTYMVALHAAEDAVLKHEALNEETNQENQSNPVVQEGRSCSFTSSSSSTLTLARSPGRRQMGSEKSNGGSVAFLPLFLSLICSLHQRHSWTADTENRTRQKAAEPNERGGK